MSDNNNRTTHILLVALIVGVAYLGWKNQPRSLLLPNVPPMPAFVPRPRPAQQDYEISEDPRHMYKPLSGRLQQQQQQQQQAPPPSSQPTSSVRTVCLDPDDLYSSFETFKPKR